MSASETYLAETDPVDPRFGSVNTVFFVIGAQKAGTTWLSHYLKAHPNVSVPEWKEHDYWNMVEGRPNASRMLLAQQERREKQTTFRSLLGAVPFTLFAKRQRSITLALAATRAPIPPYSAYADVILENVTDDTQAAGEICPEYALLKAETYAQMSRLSPNVRFIFLMRDPVTRFISGVRHTLRKSGKVPATEEDLSVALNKYAKGKSRPLSLSRYDLTITALENAVPSSKILHVFFEDMFEQDQIERICGFLGLPFVPGKISAKANSAGKKSAAVWPADRVVIAKALAPVYEFMRQQAGDALPAKWQESAALC